MEKALHSIDGLHDHLEAAAVLAYRVTRAQGFTEGNKRTALLLARWLLDRNAIAGQLILDPDERELADLLVSAASEEDVEERIIAPFVGRSELL